MINDMIIGILGATYSSIYIKEDNNLNIKATNIKNINCKVYEEKYLSNFYNFKEFIVNCKEPLFPKEDEKLDIHSLVGVPIMIRNNPIGYIIIEHTLYNFFSYEHMRFITAIANQIAIALENNFLYKELREEAIKDPLLDIYNRRYFFHIIENIVNTNDDIVFSIVMVDFDNFKEINDKYGHQFGDEVLIQTTQLIKNNLDSKDIIGRYGGEEIIIYINDGKNLKDVYEKIDNIRLKISQNTVVLEDIEINITASFGISYYIKDGDNLQEVIKIADSMLYKAKKIGKNKVVSSNCLV